MRTTTTPALFLVIACGTAADPSGLDTSTGVGNSSGSTVEASTGAGSSSGTDGTSTTGDGSTTAADGTTGEPVPPQVVLPRVSIGADELGVLVNDADPQSVAVADAYVQMRQIPAANVVHVEFSAGPIATVAEFATAQAIVEATLGDDIQALAITWTQPYRVDCMSVTSAFALGFSAEYCSTPCSLTAEVDYYDSNSTAPWTDHQLRPTMMLAGASIDEVRALIGRGIAADGSTPGGDGWLVTTTDGDRSTRTPEFIASLPLFDHAGGLALTHVDNADGSGLDWIEDQSDVLFYFTGLADVPQIATNTYLPGAVADHLTSYGGEVPVSSQMSAAAWLAAGATGSYGTVVEPCNYPAKFSDPSVLISQYFRGATLVEAYWKSVRRPGEGLFIGEPLARPWGTSDVAFANGTLTITTTWLVPGVDYDVQAADGPDGPWQTVFSGSVPYPVTLAIEIPEASAPYYRLIPS